MFQTNSDCGNWKVYGSPDPQILVAGHSHVFAMYMALNQKENFSNVFGIVSHSDFEKPIQPNSEYWDFVAKIARGRNTAISWNGNQHNIHFLIESKLKFNSIGLIQGKNYPFVSLSRIRELFRPTIYELELILSRFEDRNNLTLLGTPAPKNQQVLNQYLQNDSFFVELGEKLNISKEQLKASSNDLRVFMWNVTQELTSETAKKFGCQYLAAPAITFDENRILLDNFSTPDLTHANAEYGAVMLNEILKFYGVRVDE